MFHTAKKDHLFTFGYTTPNRSCSLLSYHHFSTTHGTESSNCAATWPISKLLQGKTTLFGSTVQRWISSFCEHMSTPTYRLEQKQLGEGRGVGAASTKDVGEENTELLITHAGNSCYHSTLTNHYVPLHPESQSSATRLKGKSLLVISATLLLST